MATLTCVVECDGFQHGTAEPFYVKCLAIACGFTRTTYTRFFDTSALLTRGTAALRTYQFQQEHHGWPITSPGLPQSAASTVIFHAIQDSLLQILEDGAAYPGQILIWTKGSAKAQYIASLLGGSPVPITVRNLEEVECPPARLLRPTGDPSTTEKAMIFAEWLGNQDLDRQKE